MNVQVVRPAVAECCGAPFLYESKPPFLSQIGIRPVLLGASCTDVPGERIGWFVFIRHLTRCVADETGIGFAPRTAASGEIDALCSSADLNRRQIN
jgi:hypothetical protein